MESIISRQWSQDITSHTLFEFGKVELFTLPSREGLISWCLSIQCLSFDFKVQRKDNIHDIQSLLSAASNTVLGHATSIHL